MKFLVSIFFSFLVFSVATATPFYDKIKIGSNSKTSQLEIRFAQKFKKTVEASVLITDAAGNTVRNFTCDVLKGSNTLCMQDVLTLDEGTYTVKMTINKKTSTTSFVLFK